MSLIAHLIGINSLACLLLDALFAGRRRAAKRVVHFMVKREFLKAGHLPTLLAAFLYFDMSFMVWVMLGPLGVQIAGDLHLDAGQKGLMVAVPVLAGALLRVVLGILVDRLKPKLTGIIGQVIVLAGLILAWLHGIHSFGEVLLLG